MLRYVEFLRQETGLSDVPPIDLTRIYQHFGMPLPLRAPLQEQQGILVNSDAGIILIKEDDPIVRQRFTEGHELMELLFDAHERQAEARGVTEALGSDWHNQRQEQWCDRGAAHLLMPPTSFVPRLETLGFSLNTARTLSQIYQTSLVATLVHMVEAASGTHALVMWHPALKQVELTAPPDTPPPQAKLRVWWRTCTKTWTTPFIPKNKSIPAESLIAQAYSTGLLQMGTEVLYFGRDATLCQVEAMPMQVGNKSCVLSLLHLRS